MAEPSKRPMSWEEARGRIDRGETGDKVATGDPAAAPLGADAEAGGVPTPPEDIRRSFEQEVAAGETRANPRARIGNLGPWIVLSIGLGIGILLAIAVLVV